MNFVYFGTPDFAADILSVLVRAGMAPCAVVTNPDRPAGRKKIMTPSPVKAAALGFGAGIDMLQPEAFDAAFVASLRAYGAEVGVLAAYGKIVPPEVFNIFPKGIVVVHPSLLPKYRGATPIQSAILSGDPETGTTLFLMDGKVDHGGIIASRAVPIDGIDSYASLAKKLAAASADLLVENLPAYVSGAVVPSAQDEAGASYTKKFATPDAFVDLETTDSEKICRMARALNPEPGAWTMKDGKRMKILEAERGSDGKLILKKIQFEGGKPQALFEAK